jgi:chitodextrinase
VAIESADRFIPAGPTGSMSATTDKAAVSIGQSIALRPISTAPPPPPPGDTEAPTTPTHVVATAISPTRVDLTWNASSDNVGIHHYDVFRNGGATRIGHTTSATYSDTTASPDTAYTYTVKAVDAIGNSSAASDAASVTTPNTPPPPPPAPQVSFRAASYAADKSATTLKIARPTGTASGDLLLASIDVLGTPTITAPAGWTLLRVDASGTALTKATYWRSAGAGEPADYVWTLSAAASASGGVHAYRNVHPTALLVSGGLVNASSTTIATPEIAIAADNSMLVAFFGIASSASITPPGGMTERGEVIGAGANKVASAGADEPHDAGPGHGHIATASKAAVSISHVIVLRPPAP